MKVDVLLCLSLVLLKVEMYLFHIEFQPLHITRLRHHRSQLELGSLWISVVPLYKQKQDNHTELWLVPR